MDYLLPTTARYPAQKAPAAHEEEAHLIRAAQAGSAEAFNQLLQAHQTRLYSLAYYLLGDAASAADATQEAMIAAYRSLRSFRHGSFKNWLNRIVTRKCYDVMRDVRRRRSISWEEFVEDDLTLTSPADGPETVAQRRELARRLEASLATLPFAERQMVVLSDVQGLSYQEIAEATGSRLGTVKSRLSRARAKLREELRASPAVSYEQVH
jgi:RNA polymerase sigma-70 factor (ECF subfamily)